MSGEDWVALGCIYLCLVGAAVGFVVRAGRVLNK